MSALNQSLSQIVTPNGTQSCDPEPRAGEILHDHLVNCSPAFALLAQLKNEVYASRHETNVKGAFANYLRAGTIRR